MWIAKWFENIAKKLILYLSLSKIYLYLLVVLVIATGIRLLGIRYGLPYTLHTDEPTIVDKALRILRTGDYNPHFFNYGSLTIYIQAIVYAAYFILRIAPGTENIHQITEMPNNLFYLPGRVSIVLAGVATVWLVYYLVADGYRSRTLGLIAASILAVLPVHVEESRYITPNVLSGLFATMSLMFANHILDETHLVSNKAEVARNYLFSGFFAGLAASTKYNSALVIIGMVMAHLLSPYSKKAAHQLSIGLGAMVFGFLVGTPYAVIDPAAFLYGIRSEQIHYKYGEGEGFWWYADYLFHTGAGQIISLLAVIGLAYGFFLNWRKHLVVNTFLICYFVFMSSYSVKFPRNLEPIAPILALNASIGIQGIINKASFVTRNTRVALLALFCAAITQPAMKAVEVGLILSRPDTLVMAGQWASENLPKGAMVCLGYGRLAPLYIPPLSKEDYIVLPFAYEELTDTSAQFWQICQYAIFDEDQLTPLPEWTLLTRFDPRALQHPGRRFGIYKLPSANGIGIKVEDFDNPAVLEQYSWLYKSDTVKASILNSNLQITYKNSQNQRDLADLLLPLNLEIRDVDAISLRININEGSFFTLETIIDGKYNRPPHLNYYKGSGRWEIVWVPLPQGSILQGLIISLTELDEASSVPEHSLSVDWLRIHKTLSLESNGQ